MTARAAEEMLQLEVIINGAPTQLIGEFVRRDGMLLARPEELAEIGLRVPAAAPRTADGLVDLGGMVGLSLRVDDATQMLFLTVEVGLIAARQLTQAAALAPEVPVRSATGATLNYSLASSVTDDRGSAGGLFDLRIFSPAGVASSTFLAAASSGRGPDESSAIRLDTTYVYSDFTSQRRYRLGDFVTGGLAWTRPVRMGGVQVSRDFSMRPDLVTFPLPLVAGQAATPSTVDVLVNGVRVLSKPTPPGPFQAPQLPMITGAGTVALTVTDALGRQVTTNLSFYSSPVLLSPGLTSLSAEAGAVRRDWGVASNDYGEAAASATWRRGLSSHLTLEAHAEAASGFAMGGAGISANLFDVAVGSLAAAASGGSGRAGGLVSVGLERISPTLSFGVSAQFASGDFQDLATISGDPAPDRQIAANVGLDLGRWGSVGLAYAQLDRRALQLGVGGTRLTLPATRAKVLTANYGVQVRGAFLYAAAFEDFAKGGGSGVSIGVTVPLGRRTSASASVDRDSSRKGYAQVQVQKSTVSIGDLGYQVYAAGGDTSHAYATAQYKAPWAWLSGGVDVLDGQATGRLDAEGAISAIGGALFASNRVMDSFAVVDTGGLKDVRVLYENQDAGRTDRHGRRLVPDLRSFDVNRLAIDPSDLPLDASLAEVEREVRPPDRSGVVVRFPVRLVRAALLVLVDEAGAPVPVGGLAALNGRAPVPVGYDGQAYVEELQAENRLTVGLPDGGTCTAAFAHVPTPGDIPKIGPLTCRRNAP